MRDSVPPVPLSIDTPRLSLREATREEVSAHGALYEDNLFRRYLTNKSARVAQRHLLEAFDTNKTGISRPHWMLSVFTTDDPQPIGLIELCQDSPLEATMSAGGLRPECWGKGYGTEMMAGLKNHAHDTLGLVVVRANALTANVASCRGLEKAGLRRIETVMAPWHTACSDTEIARFSSVRPGPAPFRRLG